VINTLTPDSVTKAVKEIKKKR